MVKKNMGKIIYKGSSLEDAADALINFVEKELESASGFQSSNPSKDFAGASLDRKVQKEVSKIHFPPDQKEN